MKIRMGFVSNSSSSSFCVVGKIYEDEKNELLYKFDEMIYDLNKINEIDPTLVTCQGISKYYDNTILGMEIENIQDNETMSQFKQRVLEQVKKIDSNVVIDDIQIYVDGGYDG